MSLSIPARQVRRDAFCGGRASSPSVGIAAFNCQPSAFRPFMNPAIFAAFEMS